MSFDLDPKAVRFIVDAINAKIEGLEAVRSSSENENAVADASNDVGYYRSLIAKLSG